MIRNIIFSISVLLIVLVYNLLTLDDGVDTPRQRTRTTVGTVTYTTQDLSSVADEDLQSLFDDKDYSLEEEDDTFTAKQTADIDEAIRSLKHMQANIENDTKSLNVSPANTPTLNINIR